MYCAGDARTLFGFALDAQGLPEDKRTDLQNGFEVLAADLDASASAKREATVKTLAALGEPEALEFVLRAMATKEPSVRALAAAELGLHARVDGKKALRERLDDENAAVRAAAFGSLRTLEARTPLTALRAGLGSKFSDVRIEALRALPALFATSPLVQGLITAHLADADASVRRSALGQLLALHPADPAVPLRTAFERGAADVRAEVLVRGALGKLLDVSVFAPIVGKALDDADADVRRIAFVVNTLARPALLAWLEARDEAFGRALADVLRRVTEIQGGKPAIPGADEVVSILKTLSSHFAVFVHPTLGDVSIFKPNIHTPLAAGDRARLIGVNPKDKRATDYIVGAAPLPAAVDLAAVRSSLVGTAPPGAPTDADREPLLAALACRTADTSLRGARGLALFGDMRALGALLTISREADPGLRREAAFALVALQDRRAEKRLAWMMSDAVATVRDAALGCFAELVGDPLAVAATALQASHEDIRVRGLDILVKQGKDKPVAEELLQSALEDEAPVVRAEAFRTLWSWHTKDPLSPLDRALAARFPDLRLRAVRELAAIAKHKEGGLSPAADERLFKAIDDRDWATAKAAYDAIVELRGKADIATHLAALGSSLAPLRVLAAQDSGKAASTVTDRRVPLQTLRGPLTKLLEDKAPEVRIAAVQTLDVLVTTDDLGPLHVGLQSSFLDLRVRAAELLSLRRDEQIISPMQAFIADKELLARQPQLIAPLRQRAAAALANLGTPKLLRYFATDLVKDEDGAIREQASRGVSNASRRGEEGYLLDLLGHADIAVRSWAGEGLARLGDVRAVPVLTGTLRHEHPPIRIGAIVSFAALGPEGHSGLLQGLEDASREVQRIVLSVILARDLRAFRKAEPPELLATALSSQRPEVRFAAARAIELRMFPDRYAAHLVEVLMPEKPTKADELAKWPDESTRARLMIGLAEALAGDRPEQRYAAAQALRLHGRPEAFFREVQRAVSPRSTAAPWVPETSPGAGESGAGAADSVKKGPLGLLRRLFAAGPEAAEDAPEAPEPKTSAEEQQRLRLLAFGAYIGLLRQSKDAIEDNEGDRVRRDAIARVVELVKLGAVSMQSATPALARALDDSNHLVRRAALAALRAVYTNDPETPLTLALASSESDVVRAALDELAARGAIARPRIVKALDSDVAEARRYAFDLLEKSAPPGSLEPLLAALGSAHADLRIGVLERLATSQDPRVVAALGKALESDHEDLRLRAAELLAGRRDERAVDVLGACLRTDEEKIASRARDALAKIGTPAATAQLAARAEEVTAAPARIALVQAIGKARGAEALDAVAARFDDDEESVRAAALEAAQTIIGPRSDAKPVRGLPTPKAPDQGLALRFGEAASKSRAADVRLAAAARLDDVTDPAADRLLVGLFGDRNVEVRARAVASYALRVEKKGAPSAPLGDVIRAGGRETMLSAAEGLAHKRGVEGAAAFRPLLLFVRAGEAGERERALLGLGTLGDARALAELETIASGGTEEAPVDEPMQAAALEALGRLHPRLADHEAKDRVRDRVESAVASKVIAIAVAAVKGLRWIADGRARGRIEGILASGTTTGERRAAAEALGELADSASELVLARALGDDDIDVRDAARAALALVFPSERTRVELLAVESEHADVSAPAAAFLAAEGDAAELLGKLGRIKSEALRARLRYGLTRRAALPGATLATLLGEGTAAARADAAWVVAVALSAITKADRVDLGKALVRAAVLAEERRHDAARRGKPKEVHAETEAEVNAVWAARLVGVAELRAIATKLLDDASAPTVLRVEAARALGAEDTPSLLRALGDPDLMVRAEAASSLGHAKATIESAKRSPLDPVMMERIARVQTLPAAGYDRAETRRIVAPVALGTKNVGPLLLHAKSRGPGRLEVIAQLGLSTAPESIALLQSLCAKGGAEPEDVRKAAFRALRRAQRRLQKEARP